ncbi:MAG: UbiA family prenyltransferase [Candidatus Latescibacterota bacterium]
MGKQVFLRICDYIFVMRPLILIPAWSFYLIGAGQALQGYPQAQHVFPAPTVLISLTAILITAYLLNQIFDRQSDEKNRKCRFLADGIFAVRTLIILALAAYAVASYTFRQIGDAQRLPLIAALILSLIYSLPPFRLCARPFVDLLANAVGFGGIAFILGHGLFPSGGGESMRLAIPYVLLVGATFLHTTVLDMTGDKETGKISTTVLIGVRSSKIAAAALHVLALAFSILGGAPLPIALTAASLPLSLYALKEADVTASSLQVQGTTLIVTLGAVILWPAYLVLLLPLILLSRYYHRRRFGLIYPGFVKKS